MEKDVIRVIIADDHVIMAEALQQMVNTFIGCSAERVFRNGREVVNCINKGYDADILITDLNMPELNGFETAAWIKTNRPEIKLVAVTMYNNEYLFRELFELGFSAVLSKNTSAKELKSVLSAVITGAIYTANISDPEILRIADHIPAVKSKSMCKVFSKKEHAILKLLVTDLSYKEIAFRLNISVRSVESYKDSFCEKFDVNSRVGITSYAVTNGLLLY